MGKGCVSRLLRHFLFNSHPWVLKKNDIFGELNNSNKGVKNGEKMEIFQEKKPFYSFLILSEIKRKTHYSRNVFLRKAMMACAHLRQKFVDSFAFLYMMSRTRV